MTEELFKKFLKVIYEIFLRDLVKPDGRIVNRPGLNLPWSFRARLSQRAYTFHSGTFTQNELTIISDFIDHAETLDERKLLRFEKFNSSWYFLYPKFSQMEKEFSLAYKQMTSTIV